MKNNSSHLYEAVLQRIRLKVSQNELTQAAIGEALGVKQSAVSYLLKGKTRLSLEQFISLAELLGEQPHRLLVEADSSLLEEKKMTPPVEEVMLRSAFHLLAYVSACRPVRAADLANPFFPLEAAVAALNDLTRVGVLELNGEFYRQKHAHVNYVPASKAGRVRRFRHQQEIHRICQQLYVRQWDNNEYVAARFNYFMLGYFTSTQIRVIEESLWRAYEKMRSAQQENAARGFDPKGEKLELWQAHMMMMTPVRES